MIQWKEFLMKYYLGYFFCGVIQLRYLVFKIQILRILYVDRLQRCSSIEILCYKKNMCWISFYFHWKDRETGVTKWTSEVQLLIKGQFFSFRMSSRRNKKISCLWKIKFTMDIYWCLRMACQLTNAQIHYESLNFHLRWKTQWKNCDHVL